MTHEQPQHNQVQAAAAFTGFPVGRPAESSRCWMLDLARLGRSSRRYPIAPDGYIPNSTIRALFDEQPPRDPEPFPATSAAKPFRPRRRLKQQRPEAAEVAAPAAESESPFVDVATRWDTWADGDDGTANSSGMLDDEEQPDEADAAESPAAVVTFARAPTPPQLSPEPQPGATTGEASRAEARAAARSKQRDQLRRMINAGHRPQPPMPPPQPPSTLQTQRADEQPQPPPQPQPQPPPPLPQPAVAKSVEKPPPMQPPPPPRQPPAPTSSSSSATPGEPRRRQQQQQQPRQRQRQRQPPKPPKPPQQQQPPKAPQPAAAQQPKAPPPPPAAQPTPPPPPPPSLPPPSLLPEPALIDKEEEEEEELQQPPDAAVAARGGDQGVQDDPSAAGNVDDDDDDDDLAGRQGVQDLPSIRLELVPPSDSDVGADEADGWELDGGGGDGGVAADDEELEAEHPVSLLGLQEEMDEVGYDEESEDEEEEESLEAGTLSDSGGDEELGLLAAILAEPWFRIANVARAKAPVADALTDLMSVADSGQEHRQMCQRLLDIKRELSLDAELELRLIGRIVAQLEQLIADFRSAAAAAAAAAAADAEADVDASEDAAELWPQSELATDSYNSLARQKGDDLLELLKSLGHEVADLSKRWTGALMAATLAAADERDRRHGHHRRRRRHHRRHRHQRELQLLPDSGRGTDSNATTASEDTEPPQQQQPQLPQERMVALTEELERLTSATATAPSAASLGAGPQEDSLLLTLLDPEAEDSPPTAVRFELPPVEAAGGSPGSSSQDDDRLRPVQERVWLPPVPTPPRPHRRPKHADTKEDLSVFDLMGDYRLKKMVENLPKIEPMRLDEITERSRQTPYRCPRLVGHLPWIEHQTGWLSDRSGQRHQMVRPDPTNYLASWRPTSISDWPGLLWPSEGIVGDSHNDREGNLDASGAHHRSQEEPGLAGSELTARRPQKMARSPAVVKFEEPPPAVREPPPEPEPSDRLSDLWDGHCRMERLARHGMHRAGVPIGPFLARDALLLLPPPPSDK